MAVKIRLSRFGKKDKPSYRLVAIEKNNKRDGKALEVLGYYDPTTSVPKVEVNRARLEFWLDKGAKPSLVVQKILHI